MEDGNSFSHMPPHGNGIGSAALAVQPWHRVKSEGIARPAYMKWIAATALVLALAAAAAKVAQIAGEIQQQSLVDEARPADAIIVLGAAEYRGKPSPVLQARLNHALFLYLKGLAPRIIT